MAGAYPYELESQAPDNAESAMIGSRVSASVMSSPVFSGHVQQLEESRVAPFCDFNCVN